MKVVAIVASARKEGNSEILAKAMLKALPAVVEKRLIRLADKNIEPCRACYACLPQGCSCVIKDDFAEVLAAIREADGVIIASPVYFLGMHTRLKLICDRLIAVLNDGETYGGRRCVLAIPYGVKGWQGYGVEATVSVARFLHLDVVGVLPVHAANPGEAVQSAILAKAGKFAARLLQSRDAIDEQNIWQPPFEHDLTCPFCGSGLLRLSPDGNLRCGLCDARGNIKDEAGTMKCDWQQPNPLRFSLDGMKEHGERLESIKAEYLNRRRELSEARKPYRDMAW